MSNGELSQVNQLSKWEPSGTDEASLLNELRVCLSLSIENVMKAARIVLRFDELEISTARLDVVVPPQILKTLRLIGHGKIIPEVFVRLNGKVQNLVSMLPLGTQKELLGGKPLVVFDGDQVVQLPVHELSPSQATQVFRSDFTKAHIRTPEEQQEYLTRSRRPDKSSPTKGKTSPARPNREREQEIEDVLVEPKNGCANELIRYHCDKLLVVLNRNPTIDSNTTLSLRMVSARIGQVMASPSRWPSVGTVVGRIVSYLDVNGPTLASSAAMAIGITHAEFMEAVNGSRSRFVVTGKEISLAGHRA